ncbi:hypothetical protein [Herbidospora cretacea]|uniref:hypothetical protein n=1 Tax=Herbidospora cretacea TaxID=28444 RepID=UPI000773F8D6|nr:hypothetical protein [Herbidospora cretacea]
MSSWTDRFSAALTALQDAYGAAFDWSTQPFEVNTPAYIDITNRLGRVLGGVTNAFGNTLAGAAEGTFEGVGWGLENLVAEPISAAATTASLTDSPAWRQQLGAANWMEAVSKIGTTWDRARKMADTRSAGNSLALMFATDDVLAEEARISELQDGFLWNATTGTIDAAISWFGDPTIVGLKAVSGANAVRKGFNVGHRASDRGWTAFLAGAGVGPGVQSADDIADSRAVTNFLKWKQGKSGREIANHQAVKASAYPSVMAGLLQEADEQTSRLIIAVGYGSEAAYQRLASRRDDLAFRIARADNILNSAVDFELVKSGTYKTFLPKALPSQGPKAPEPEQLPLFDIGQFPAGEPGMGGKAAKGKKKAKSPTDTDDLDFGGQPAGKSFEYPSISGNLPKTVQGNIMIAPKAGDRVTGLGGISVDAGPYMMSGPVNEEAIKDLIPYFNGLSQADAYRAIASLDNPIPGLPPKPAWQKATDWQMHDETLNALGQGFDESSSMRIKPWPIASQRAMLMAQEEIKRKSGSEMELLIAAIGPGGENPGRGVWASMQDYAIRNDRDLAKADRALAYDWSSKSLADESVIFPKAFGLPVRVIRDFPLGVARSFTQKRAPSWIDFNRGDSHAGFAAFLNGARIFSNGQRETYMRQYMAAWTPEAKRKVVEAAETDAINFMAIKYGLDDEAAAALAKESTGTRNRLVKAMTEKRENKYASPAVLDHIAFDDDVLPVTSRLFETQAVNSMPLLNLDRYERVFRANSEILSAFARKRADIGDFMDKAHDVFSQVWSFSVLMRFGYTIRTLTDDMLRSMAALGAMSIMGGINAGLKTAFTWDMGNAWSWGDLIRNKQITLKDSAPAKRLKNAVTHTKIGALKLGAGALATKAMDSADLQELRSIVQEAVDRHGRDLESVRIQTEDGFEYRGHYITGAYEGVGKPYKEIVGGSYDAIARTSKEMIERLRSEYAAWDVKNPTDADHLSSWLYAINEQIFKSPLGKRFMRGETAEQVERWLRRTPEGQHVRKLIGPNGKDPELLAGMAQAIVDHYVPVLRAHENPMILRDAVFRGQLDEKMLEEFFPDVAMRPQVHGPTIDWNLHQGGVRKWMDSIVSNGFKWLSQVPTDRLIRHPTFRVLYQDSVKRQIDNAMLSGEDVTWGMLSAFEHTARETALKNINNLLYNVSSRSNAAHAARFMTGFFSAWEDSIKRWSQLAVAKPQLLFYGSKIWDAPNNMNLGSTENEFGQRVPRLAVVDEHGRQVKSMVINGRTVFATYDEDTGKWSEFNSNLNDKTKIVARLPDWLRKWIGEGAESYDAVPIPKSSLNLILQGDPWWLPGAGPLMQIPITQLQQKNPTGFQDVYKWAIPFGPQSFADVMLPGWLKQKMKANEGIEDPSYAFTWTQIMQTEEMRIREGRRTRPASEVEFRKEIDRRTQAAYNVRSFTRFFLPFSADLQSPYQFFIDRYQQMREHYGQEADERFYEKYGDDLYIFTNSLSKGNIGATATKTAWEATKKHGDLIAQNPEYGALIMGPDVMTGKFDQYVHSAQFGQKVGPGSLMTTRERRSPLDALRETNIRLGWTKLNAWMNELNAEAVEKGLDDKTVAKVRTALTERLSAENKDWGDEYTKSDRDAIPKRIEFFKSLVQNAELLSQPNRTDLRTLNEYLKARAQFVAILQAKQKAQVPYTLDAQANAHIKNAWERVQRYFEISDTRFGDLFSRYLTNDKLQF